MIAGSVCRRRALVELALRGAASSRVTREFLLDTGFDGFLTLPPGDIATLALPFSHRTPATMADGSVVFLDVHEAFVTWESAELLVDVLASGGELLLEMTLLDGHEIKIRVEEGGLVEIAPIPP